VWAPRYVGPALVLRGLLQPLSEWQASRNRGLGQALTLADPPNGVCSDEQTQLGVAMQAVVAGSQGPGSCPER
jgi:hypothetical protein